MSRRLLVVCSVMLLATALAAQTPDGGGSSATVADEAIANVLHAQVDAWNRGDLTGFMSGYWNSPELVFAAGKQETRGWEPVLKRYQARYQSGGAEMGKLYMAYSKPAHMLGPDLAYVDGDYKLTKSDGGTSSGVFTLIFRKFPEGWRIVHDRTCSE